ncbi:MAG: hypothetical protein Q8875_02985, partial [Pigeon pea little leaf phytoplasma]|nr:hypothetical protein [Pigeon pea little leaf phytoplasma]
MEVDYHHYITASMNGLGVVQLGLLNLFKEEIMHMECSISPPGVFKTKQGGECFWGDVWGRSWQEEHLLNEDKKCPLEKIPVRLCINRCSLYKHCQLCLAFSLEHFEDGMIFV